ncbi:MAG TPA: 2-dehydro-3-deoxygalactonokinase [Geminicoccus sp.]|uniref:2-dehydro-3-deoxygalactonokinase n=1 Tax=Geminicoccus sp. TaxID=2024832 RepID=UPI002E33DBA7|nr:2-dehydro-3-deoxygalactonokinase [Geminicoccus sp.]HEX2528990.1 2-dehydro-3-deoxygalactonokinase [Geminicoccus sp.]
MAALIGLDWGTSSLRAALMDADGTIRDRYASGHGITHLPEGGFEAAFAQAVGRWHQAAPDLPVIASGMVGARTGWREAPYVHCPGSAEDIAANLLTIQAADGTSLRIVPGMSTRNAAGVPDVMRGEETQILGCLADGKDSGLFVLPGTHSKWVQEADGRINGFASYMTGELFAVLREHTIFRHTMAGTAEPDIFDADAFAAGVRRAADGTGGGLLRRLFGARALALFGELSREAGTSWLSGLLIGTELVEAKDEFGPPPTDLTLVGGATLADRYARAAAQLGIPTRPSDPDAAFKGQFHLARLAGLLAENRP